MEKSKIFENLPGKI